jgi:hypothetical protein
MWMLRLEQQERYWQARTERDIRDGTERRLKMGAIQRCGVKAKTAVP